MPENLNLDISEKIIKGIKAGEIKMRPRWYFVLGSISLIGGLIGLTILSIFLTSLISFSLRTHGPMGSVRLEILLSSFPWWSVVVLIAGLGLGVWLFKKYDFSYKKNFPWLILGFIISIIIGGWLINLLGLDNIWMKTKPMNGLYKQYDGGQHLKGQSWRFR